MKKENPGIAIKLYRIERWFYTHNLKICSKFMSRFLYLLCNCVIPPTTVIEEGVIIPHSVGIVIHQNTKIGKNTTIYQNVSIGNADGPQIGENCIIGSGAVILGNIKIGNNSKIGANAVVLNDVPQGATVVGVPARMIDKK